MMVYTGFIFPFMLFGTCKSVSIRVKFRHVNDMIVPSSAVSTMEKTRIGCCRFCASQRSCTAALYYPSGNVCEIFSTQLLISPATMSPAGSLYIKGTMYKLVKNMWSWFDAKNNCEVDGGQLVKIDSAEEHNKLLSWLQEYGHNSDPTSWAGPWIGLNDLEQEGKFSWLDGSPLAGFQAWAGPNPSNTGGEEHCVHIYFSLEAWNDVYCTYLCWSICEYD